MNFSTLRRRIAILLLGVSLLASAANAAELRMAADSQTFKILSTLASFLDFFWAKNGGSLDPDGEPKEGGSLDPNGLNKEGASLDPNGRPVEAGGSLDPWGLCGQRGCDGPPPQ